MVSNNGDGKRILLEIGINKENEVIVGGDLNNKTLLYHLIASAIR